MRIGRITAVAVVGVAAGALTLGTGAYANHATPEISTSAGGDGCTLTVAAAGEMHVSSSTVTAGLVVDAGGEVQVDHGGLPTQDGAHPFAASITVGPFDEATTVRWRLFGGPVREDDSPAWDTGAHPDWVDFVTQLESAQGRAWSASDDGPFVTWHEQEVPGCPDDSDEESGDEGNEGREPQCVDVNTADAEGLRQLRHIDADRAAQILNLRPFASVDDLDRVDGLRAGGPRLAELVAGGDGFLPLCDIAAAGGGGGSDELPVTGAPTVLLAGGGVGLLALGGAGYLVARRRRVSFTA